MPENKSVDWQDSDSPEDDGRAIDALVVAGLLSANRVAAAAGLQHAGSLKSSVQPQRLVSGYRTRIHLALLLLPHRENVRFALDCASRTLPYWLSYRPADSRVERALTASLDWLNGEGDRLLLQNISDACAAIAQEINRSFRGEVTSVEAEAAICAASAASSASGAAECAASGDNLVSNLASAAAKAAANGATDYVGEIQWQVKRIASLLLTR